ncbi:MoaD/ThiS family protein [Thermodesulfobacteriota bacterium]
MVISVDFHGLQRKLTRTDRIEIPIQEGKRVTDIMVYLKECFPGLPLNEDMLLVTVNNQITSPDQILEADDSISFIPHIGGG